jgi:hypothetical protein
MNFRLENIGMLLGLFALAVPILLHLLQRRRYDTLDWGAMQFLPDSFAAQRRRWLDEILLMLLRMLMIALIVIALATPVSTSAWLAPLGDRSSREIVVIVDGSYSMDVRVPNQPTPWLEALNWVRTHIEEAPSSDRFTFLIARQPPLFVTESELALATPGGNPDMPRALAEAWKHLQRSKAATTEIIVLTDMQQHGWADLETLAALENLGNQWHADGKQAKSDGLAAPSLRVVKVGGELPKSLPNYSLAPLTASRGIVKIGQKISFQSALLLDKFDKYVPPRSVKILIDGTEINKLDLPTNAEVKQGQIPLSYQHRFEKKGQHVVSLIVDADPTHDVLAADNEQHVVVDVVKELSILLVDGDKQLSPESSTFFLQRALLSKQAVPVAALKPALIDAVKPAVIVLADVPRLDTAQIDALDRFLAEGGGLLIVAGERISREKTFYNEQLFRDGQGWLPARLGEIASAEDGMQPEPGTFQHPALELFRTAPAGSMNQIRFSNWWKVALNPKDRATAIGMLANGDPFLIEKPYEQGRVILCTLPPDRRWNSTLPNAWEYPILLHELAYYLAGSRNVASTLRQGMPIRIDAPATPTQRLTLNTPEVSEKTIDVKSWPWIYDNTGAVGVYQVQGSNGKTWPYVVPPDLRESNLTRCSADDWRKVQDRLPIEWHEEGTQQSSIVTQDAHREELWWLLLLGVLGLLCTEVWMTRRMALARGR